jgi:AraC-like DNA-binding protein
MEGSVKNEFSHGKFVLSPKFAVLLQNGDYYEYMKVFYERNELQLFVFPGENLTFPSHLHKELEFILCLEGEIAVSCNDISEILKPNDFMLVCPNNVHSYNTTMDNQFILCIVSMEYLPLFKDYFLHQPESPYIKNEHTQSFRKYVTLLAEEYNHERNREAMVGYMHLILSEALRKMTFLPDKQPKYDDILPELLLYLEENFKSSMSLSEVATHFGLNSSYLSRLLSMRLNCTYTYYLQELRIEFAKHLLNTSTMSITQVGFESGFPTQRTFNRTFRKIAGISPREYRTKSVLTSR